MVSQCGLSDVVPYFFQLLPSSRFPDLVSALSPNVYPQFPAVSLKLSSNMSTCLPLVIRFSFSFLPMFFQVLSPVLSPTCPQLSRACLAVVDCPSLFRCCLDSLPLAPHNTQLSPRCAPQRKTHWLPLVSQMCSFNCPKVESPSLESEAVIAQPG